MFTSGPPTCPMIFWLNYSRILQTELPVALWFSNPPPSCCLKSLSKMQIEADLPLLKPLVVLCWQDGVLAAAADQTASWLNAIPFHGLLWPLPLSHLVLFCSQVFTCLALYTWNVLKSLHSHLILPFPAPTHPVFTRKEYSPCFSKYSRRFSLLYLVHFLYNYFKLLPSLLNCMFSCALLTERKYWINN